MAAQSNTQIKIDALTKQLADTNREIDSLDLLGPPSSDLAAEEKAALGRMVKREALHRVSAALNSELAELRVKLAAEKEEVRRAKLNKANADFEHAKAAFVESLWKAYAEAEKLVASCAEQDKLDPTFQPRTSHADGFAERIATTLQELGSAKLVVNGHTMRREVSRLTA